MPLGHREVNGHRPRCLVDVTRQAASACSTCLSSHDNLPTFYVLNAAALTKSHAVEHLAADITGYKVDVAVISETHLKKKHVDHNFHVNDFSLFRRDRVDRRGGGVAVYVTNRLSADIWTCPGDSSQFELLWVRVQAQRHEVVVGALYHPPKPLYKPTALLDYIEAGVDALTAVFSKATIVLAGDFNTLENSALVSRTALSSIVTRPTRGANILDRIYVNDLSYATVRVVTSTVRSDHKALIAYTGQPSQPLNKTKQRLVFRRCSPAQHAMFLEHVSQLNIELDRDTAVQTNFDIMYSLMYDLFDQFDPERAITVTSSDQHTTSPLQSKLCRGARTVSCEQGELTKLTR